MTRTANSHPLAARMIRFIDHLRLNKFALGPTDTEAALRAIANPLTRIDTARHTLKAVLTGCHEEWRRFDDLFEAFWLRGGRERQHPHREKPDKASPKAALPSAWQNHFTAPSMKTGQGPKLETESDGAAGDAATGRLIGSDKTSRAKTDLRNIVDPAEIHQAELLAYRLARAMQYRLSRRHRISKTGRRLDLRRTIRASLAHGGEPLVLKHRARPDRPVRLVILLDVSGSMKHYSRFFLQFVKGLICRWMEADAYLFHTRLIRVTGVLRDKNAIRAMTRLSLMAEGFGGGTKLGESLAQFNKYYAKQSLNSRTVVMILSDGYDTGSLDQFVGELKRLKKRAPKLIWLNPLLGWRNYQPVTDAMNAARPYIDYFAAANTLASLAEIEPEIAKI